MMKCNECGKEIIEEKIEDAMNKAVDMGIFPKYIYLNMETLKALASELKGERVVDYKEGEPIPRSSVRTGDHIAYFKVDKTLAWGEIVITEKEKS